MHVNPGSDEAARPDARRRLTLCHMAATWRAFLFSGALVAELVDAQVSGTCNLTVVEVRVFSRAPTN